MKLQISTLTLRRYERILKENKMLTIKDIPDMKEIEVMKYITKELDKSNYIEVDYDLQVIWLSEITTRDKVITRIKQMKIK